MNCDRRIKGSRTLNGPWQDGGDCEVRRRGVAVTQPLAACQPLRWALWLSQR